MSRLLSVLLGAILCVSASSANAAFIFSFNPSSLVNAAPGSSGSFQVDIVGTGLDAAGGSVYFFSLASDNSNFTVPAFFISGPFLAPSSVSVNFAVSSLATVGETANITGQFTAVGPSGQQSQIPFENRLTLTAITAVPEPSSIAMVGLCAVAGVVVHRRRQRRQA